MEQLVEGTFGKLFPPPLHPSDLVRALMQAMEIERVVVDDQVIFPDRYWVFLNPGDCVALRSDEQALLAELERCVYRLAEKGGGRCGGPLLISLHSPGSQGSQASLATGEIRVRAGHSAQPESTGAVTHRMATIPASAPDARRWMLWLAGCAYPLGQPVIRMGRALSNDIVLDDLRISRRHAQLRWRDGKYFVSDLDSRQGVRVNGHRVPAGHEHPLAQGDCINLAGLVLVIGREDEKPAPLRKQGTTADGMG